LFCEDHLSIAYEAFHIGKWVACCDRHDDRNFSITTFPFLLISISITMSHNVSLVSFPFTYHVLMIE
jgi:hypothetical protein